MADKLQVLEQANVDKTDSSANVEVTEKTPIPNLKMSNVEEKLEYEKELAKQYEDICLWIDSLDLPNDENNTNKYSKIW